MKKNIKTYIFFLLALAVIYLLPKIINLPLPFEGTQILAIFIAVSYGNSKPSSLPK